MPQGPVPLPGVTGSANASVAPIADAMRVVTKANLFMFISVEIVPGICPICESLHRSVLIRTRRGGDCHRAD